MENQDVRRAARGAGVPLWRVAAEIGVSEPTIHRWLRFPLSAEKKEQIMEAIRSLADEYVLID